MRALHWSACLILLAGCSHMGERSTPPPSARTASVQGGLRPDQVQRAIEYNLLVLEQATAQNWPGAGKVQVSFVVTPDGFANDVELRSSFNNPDFEKKLSEAVRNMSFPVASSSTYVRAFPVYFQ